MAEHPCLAERTVVILGGTSGIGRALALGLAKAGARVTASSRSQHSTQSIADELEKLGQRSFAQASDVCDRTSLESLHRRALAEFGRIDVLVNCAGRTERVPTLHCTEEQWNGILDTNLTGTLRACQIFGHDMLRRGDGRIINIASLSSFVSYHEVAAYSASKAAVASLTRSLAVEWSPHGVLVNAIAPGIMPTALNSALLDSPRGEELRLRTPMGRFGDMDELISAATYLASPATTFTTGQVLVVDGGILASGVNR